jgi:hypothetical protein
MKAKLLWIILASCQLITILYCFSGPTIINRIDKVDLVHRSDLKWVDKNTKEEKTWGLCPFRTIRIFHDQTGYDQYIEYKSNRFWCWDFQLHKN